MPRRSPSRRIVLSIVVAVAGFAAGCARPATAPAPRSVLRLATGLQGMTFRPLGEALAAAVNQEVASVQLEVVETSGSVANVDRLDQGSADFGLALADVAYMAVNGRVSELGRRASQVRGVAVLHPSTVHVLVGRSSSMASLADLRGHRVGVGPAGSGTAVTSAILLRAFGVPADSVQLESLPFLDAIDALRREALDAVIITAADPVAVVRQAINQGARLLDVKGTQVERLRVAYPFLRRATIPADTYQGQATSVQTVRVDVVLLCRSTLDETLVHTVTDALFRVLPRVASSGDFLRMVDVRRAPATPIPLHPGAAWYYREQELSR